MRSSMEVYKTLSEHGIDINIANQYQILCLPGNIEDEAEDSELFDSGDSITLSKLLKAEGIKCANSYDLGLNTKVTELRGAEVWLGTIWVLSNVALPVLNSVVGRLLGEGVQRKLDASKQLKDSTEGKELGVTIVHANLKILTKNASTEIKHNGSASTFLKLLNSINDEE